MGTYCAPLVAYLFLLCYDRDFTLSLSESNQADIVKHDLLNDDNPLFE